MNTNNYEVWDCINSVIIEVKATCKPEVYTILIEYFKMEKNEIEKRFKIYLAGALPATVKKIENSKKNFEAWDRTTKKAIDVKALNKANVISILIDAFKMSSKHKTIMRFLIYEKGKIPTFRKEHGRYKGARTSKEKKLAGFGKGRESRKAK